MVALTTKNPKRITFLVGAGGTVPFLKKDGKPLSTQLMTQELFNKDRWTSILAKTNDLCGGEINCKFKLPIEVIYNFLTDILLFNFSETPQEILAILESTGVKGKEAVPIYVTDLNFEHILYFLDKICNSLVYPNRSIDNYLLDFWSDGGSQKKNKYSKHKGWDLLPYLAREVLVSIILDFWEADDKKDAIQVNKDFFSRVFNEFSDVNIYSLNYDPLIYESIKDLGVNFGMDSNRNFDSGIFLREKQTAAFLHGHIGFVYSGRSLKLVSTYREAQENRLKGVCSKNLHSGYQSISVKGIHYNTYFVSGLDKFEAFYNNPFAAYMMRFSKDIIDSDYVVLIGIGGQDNHLNLFLKNKTVISETAKIIDVNYKPDEERKNINIVSGLNRDILERMTLLENPATLPAGNDLKSIQQAQQKLWAEKGMAYSTRNQILELI